MNKPFFEKEIYKISVIVPIYNIEDYIRQCIESIIRQTYSNLQIILVDDGSTDSSGKICDRYAEQDDRIQVIHQANAGLVSARKAGLKIAEGEFIGFVDGDDFIEPNFYESLLNFILEDQADFVHTGCIYEQHNVSTKKCQFENKIYELEKDTAVEIINDNVLGSGGDCYINYNVVTKLYRNKFIKKCYDKVPNYQSMGEDLVCLCICLLEGKRLSLHKEALYHYIMRPDSIVNLPDIKTVLKICRLYNSLLDVFENYNVVKEVEQSLEKSMMTFILSSLTRSGKFCDFINTYIFDKVNLIENKEIVIYGAGIVGQGYYAQLCKYSSVKIVGWVDADYKNKHFSYSEVIGIEEIRNMRYDLILIAVKYKDVADEIKEQLQNMNVPESKMIWEKPRSLVDYVNIMNRHKEKSGIG